LLPSEQLTDMSDEFDREAEREKLREQFGEEEDDRERTERLSELLLKGATMTDRHCPECGDPVFRHEGREFCPSCQREVTTEEARRATAGQAAARDPTDAGASPDADANANADTNAAVDAAADRSTIEVDTPGGTDTDGSATDGTVPTTGETDAASPTERAGNAPQGGQPAAGSSGGESRPQPQPQPTASEPAPSASGGESGLLPARQHLTRTVNRLAQQAAAEEDPGRKREFLAATREAAEALEAVRDAE
jgi:uncharacterized Zn finger protein (UPF0148 family)